MSEEKMFDYAMQIVAAEETARITAEEMAKVQRVVEVKPLPTHIIDRKGVPVDGEELIINEIGHGTLQELMFKAVSSAFSVSVWRDEKLEINGSYSHYAEISQEVDEVAAFTRGGYYIFHVSDIEFEQSLVVKLSTARSVTFSRIFAKYKLGRN